jgi:serine/threonine protein phosphatase PrpC
VSQGPPASPTPRPELGVLASPPPPVAVRSYGMTDRGNVRPSNEDHFLIAELVRTLRVHQTSLPQPQAHYGRNRGHILLVADGMGGHRAGAVASALSVASVEAFLLHVLHRFSNLRPTEEQGVIKEFREALRQADARIFEEAAQHPELAGMGTTLTMAFVSGWKLFVVHAGDSRCYLFHKGRLQRLTADHTLAAEMARRGMLEEEDIPGHHFRHVMLNVLGGTAAGVQVDVQRVELEAGDVVLLCTDGLTEMVSEDWIAATLAGEPEPEAGCAALVAEANARGGRDNITAVLARFEAG